METKIEKQLSVAVTATLAELYEKQQHYFAAYIIYSLLYRKSGDLSHKSKMESLKREIYNPDKVEMHYNPLLKEIFSEEELKDLCILDKKSYLEYKETLNNLQRDEIDEMGSVQEEATLGRISQVIGTEWKKFIDEAFANSGAKSEQRNKFSEEEIDLNEIKLSDFVAYLTEYEGDHKRLGEVKLAELMGNFLAKQRIKTDCNDEE